MDLNAKVVENKFNAMFPGTDIQVTVDHDDFKIGDVLTVTYPSPVNEEMNETMMGVLGRFGWSYYKSELNTQTDRAVMIFTQ